MIYQQFKSAAELPEVWDTHTESYFQTREFLLYTENYNPCGQTYYIYHDNGLFISGAVLYSLPIDLFTFLGIKSPIKMRICGIPCSVSASGLLGNTVKELIAEINHREKGFKLFLNLTSLPESGGAGGTTFPSVMMDFPYPSIAEYEKALRNDYRRRFHKTQAALKMIRSEISNCSDFGEPEYNLYREVLKRSKGKLETLSQEFFTHLPEKFRLTRFFTTPGKLIGWNITVKHQSTLYFFLGGIDYRFNRQYSTYFNLLYNIISQAAELKVEKIDFGQTAEEPKIRTGGKIDQKYMIGFHSNPLVQTGLKLFKGFLEYKPPKVRHCVFKNELIKQEQ